MEDPKAFQLFEQILANSRARKIAWQPTADADIFVAVMRGKYTLKIFPFTEFDQYGEKIGPPSLEIHNDKGTLLVNITSSIANVTTQDLEELAILAHRTAHNVDAQIDELLQDLKDDADIPF